LPPTSDSVPVGAGQRILLVDDEPALAEAASLSLEHYGYRVIGLHSAADALAAFHRQPGGFDLVITDLTMPGMSGIELANALYEARPELPVILASGFGSARTSHFGHGPGIRAVLPKPFTTDVLARTVHQLLAVESNK
jgi:DNA-binding NtrC family response regulator